MTFEKNLGTVWQDTKLKIIRTLPVLPREANIGLLADGVDPSTDEYIADCVERGVKPTMELHLFVYNGRLYSAEPKQSPYFPHVNGDKIAEAILSGKKDCRIEIHAMGPESFEEVRRKGGLLDRLMEKEYYLERGYVQMPKDASKHLGVISFGYSAATSIYVPDEKVEEAKGLIDWFEGLRH